MQEAYRNFAFLTIQASSHEYLLYTFKGDRIIVSLTPLDEKMRYVRQLKLGADACNIGYKSRVVHFMTSLTV